MGEAARQEIHLSFIAGQEMYILVKMKLGSKEILSKLEK